MSNHQITAEDQFKSLTGYDEIAIQNQFGEDVAALRNKPFRFMRALVFVDLRRKDGTKDAAAYQATQAMTMGELESYFAEDEALAEDSDLGKGEPPAS